MTYEEQQHRLFHEEIARMGKRKKKTKPPYVRSEAVIALEEMNHEARLKEYPNTPNLAYQRFKDDSANALTKCIVKYIELLGGFASRISSTGQYRNDLQRWIPSQTKKGVPDISGLLHGASLSIEVKIGRDVMSADQLKVKENIERAGGRYYIAKDFAGAKEWIDNLV